jgi:RNA polymerase sigma factor (sigma-70 family)
VKFRTFAGHRVRGAMADHLRDFDWVPRQERKRGNVPAVGSLSDVFFRYENSDRAITNAHQIADTRGRPAADVVSSEDAIRQALSGLTRAEMLMVRLAYVEGWPLRDVARAVGFGPSRVSQMLFSVRRRLMASLPARSALDLPE